MSRKAENLIKLARHGIKVPRGFHLDESHYRDAIGPVRDALAAASHGANAVSEIFDHVRMPARTDETLRAGLQPFPASTRFAVRSSGNVVARGRSLTEDGSDVSLAGQFESFLNVPRERVPDAVRQCWASLFNDRSIQLFGVDAAYVDGSTMTVVIQEMVVAAASAVAMSVDPLSDGTVGGIELTVGPCEAIVSGVVNPDEVTFRRSDCTIVERRIGTKKFTIEYDLFSRGSGNSRLIPLPSDVCDRFAVPDHVLSRIIKVVGEVEGIFGVPQDIELVVDHAEQITVVQSRNISRLPSPVVPIHTARE